MLEAAMAPETGVGVSMVDMPMEPETLLGIAVVVGVGDGNVRWTGVLLVCWRPSWLDEQANEPTTKTSRMEVSVYFLKGLGLAAVVG